MSRLGIDLGGTKVAAVVLNDAGEIVWQRRVATPRGSYPQTIDALASLVADAERETATRCTVGIGIPGAISPATGLIKNANSTWLNGSRLHADLEARLGREVRLANDANCFAISEATDGAAAGARVVFGVILGTGTGGGVVVNGAMLTGQNAIAGEWGHNPLPWPEADERPGPACYCGLTGCIESFLSGPALAADYARRGGVADRSEDVVSKAEAGETIALATLDTWERRLARSLATIINVLDPDVIVCGGGLSNLTRLYEQVPRLRGQWVFSDAVSTRLVRAKHGDASGVRGAAWLWPPRTP
jgi:fructokinase